MLAHTFTPNYAPDIIVSTQLMTGEIAIWYDNALKTKEW